MCVCVYVCVYVCLLLQVCDVINFISFCTCDWKVVSEKYIKGIEY